MSRPIRLFLVSAVVLFAIGLAGAWVLYREVGRTPDELINYAERELAGEPALQRIAVPVLVRLRYWFGETGLDGRPLPFEVPRLPPNPALSQASTSPASAGQGSGLSRNAPARRDGRIIRVGPGREFASIAMAAKSANNGDTVEIDAGDYRADVASWEHSVTIRGLGNRVRLIASGAHAEGKAIWVIRGSKVVVENIAFIGARVPDHNGGGIRLETGHLVVRNSLFFNNETGILTSNTNAARLEIENCEFAFNGRGDGLTHQLYVGKIQSLKVTGSYFHHANAGHQIKSRAASNFVAYNRITDESGGRASYEVEFPVGGVAYVIGNIIGQGSSPANSDMISFGAEGYSNPSNRLYLAHNTMVNKARHGGTFLRVMPGAQHVGTWNNLLVGPGRIRVPGREEAAGNVQVDWEAFFMAARDDYRLTEAGRKHRVTPPGSANGVDLKPDYEYVHPLQLRKLAAIPEFPGAIQTPAPSATHSRDQGATAPALP